MCCAYALGPRLAAELGLGSEAVEIRPSDKAVVFLRTERGLSRALLRFGFAVSSRNGENGRNARLLLNARAETLFERPLFRTRTRQRLFVPATQFYEWDSSRRRHSFTSTDESSLYFAGLHDGTGFVIITTAATPLLQPIHSRMPLILARNQLEPWLFDDAAAARLLAITPQMVLTDVTPRRQDSLLSFSS